MITLQIKYIHLGYYPYSIRGGPWDTTLMFETLPSYNRLVDTVRTSIANNSTPENTVNYTGDNIRVH